MPKRVMTEIFTPPSLPFRAVGIPLLNKNVEFCGIKSLLRSNRVTAIELTHVKRINKYLLFRPHISVEYNNISWCSEEDTSRIH